MRWAAIRSAHTTAGGRRELQAVEFALARGRVHVRREAALRACQWLEEAIRLREKAGLQGRRDRRRRARWSPGLRAVDRGAEHVGEALHGPVANRPCRRRRAARRARLAASRPVRLSSPPRGRRSGSRRFRARRARARAAPVARVRPKSAPRHSASQYGAPRPTKAGTRMTSCVGIGRRRRARRSRCALCTITPSPSRSHCTAAPATKIEPSSA